MVGAGGGAAAWCSPVTNSALCAEFAIADRRRRVAEQLLKSTFLAQGHDVTLICPVSVLAAPPTCAPLRRPPGSDPGLRV